MASLDSKFDQMMAALGCMSSRIDQVNHSVGALSDVVAQHGCAISELATKSAETKADQDSKIAKLEAQMMEISAALAPASRTWPAPSGATSSWARGPPPGGDAAASEPAPRLPPPSFTSSLSGADPLKVIVKGFRRHLMKEHFQDFYEHFKAGANGTLDEATPNIPNHISKIFTIRFKSKDDVTRFLKGLPDVAPALFEFKAPDADITTIIKFSRDQPMELRNCTSRLSKLWEPTIAALTAAKCWSAEKYVKDGREVRRHRLANQNRCLFLVHDGMPFPLFYATNTKNDITVKFDEENARKYGILDFVRQVAAINQ